MNFIVPKDNIQNTPFFFFNIDIHNVTVVEVFKSSQISIYNGEVNFWN